MDQFPQAASGDDRGFGLALGTISGGLVGAFRYLPTTGWALDSPISFPGTYSASQKFTIRVDQTTSRAVGAFTENNNQVYFSFFK